MAGPAARVARALVVSFAAAFAECSEEPIPIDHAAAATVRVPLQAVVVDDDDGSRRARVEPRALVDAVEFANRTFAAVGIVFDFSPDLDVATVESTRLDDVGGPPVLDWAEVNRADNRVAAGLDAVDSKPDQG